MENSFFEKYYSRGISIKKIYALGSVFFQQCFSNASCRKCSYELLNLRVARILKDWAKWENVRSAGEPLRYGSGVYSKQEIFENAKLYKILKHVCKGCRKFLTWMSSGWKKIKSSIPLAILGLWTKLINMHSLLGTGNRFSKLSRRNGCPTEFFSIEKSYSLTFSFDDN